MTFLLVLALLFIGTCVLIGIAAWISAKGAVVRNIAAFLLSAGAAYATNYVLYFWVLAKSGVIRPASNVAWPSFTWISIAVICFVAASSAKPSRFTRAIPFALSAVLVLALAPASSSVSMSEDQQIEFIALPLIVLGILIAMVDRSRNARRPARAENDQTQEEKL
jgi:hypothetical protein